MAVARISQLQKRILRWLATDHRRTRGMMASSHQELVQALQGDKGNMSHSLQTVTFKIIRPSSTLCVNS
jgi:hypothetical protein